VRQLLTRVPDELHARLAARAEREGRSVNALVVDLLTGAVSEVGLQRRDRLRAKATRLRLASHVTVPVPIGPTGTGALEGDAAGVVEELDDDRDWRRYGDGPFPDADSRANAGRPSDRRAATQLRAQS
jgi:plasmid stability protein